MSFKAAVGVTPSQILFGTQGDVITVVNTGSATAYVSDGSDVTAGYDLALDVGGSVIIAPGSPLWAVCDTGTSTTLTLVNQFGERFAYGQPVARSLGATIGGASAVSGVVVYDETAASQFGGMSLAVRFQTGSPTFGEWKFTFTTSAVPPGVVSSPGFSGGITYESVVNTVYTAGFGVTGLPSFGVVFPVPAYGGKWYVTPPSGTPASSWTVDVVGVSQPPAQPLTWSVDAGQDAQTVRYGNTFNISGYTLAASSTLNVGLPATNGPVRVAVQYTQTGAGASSATPRVTVGQYGTSNTTVPFDVAIASSAAAGSVTGYATYAVWPVTPMFLRFTTAAGVSLSAIQVTVIAGTL